MTNPIPSEAEIEAAAKAAEKALAVVEELRKQREAAEKAATDKAALMAACETAIDAGRFELVNGELVDAHASRGLSPDEKFILTLARKGRVTVDELTGTKVVLDDAIGNAQKSASAPQLTDDEWRVLQLMRGSNPRVKLTTLGGKEVVVDKLFGRQRAEQKRRDEAERAARAAAQQPSSDPGAGNTQAPPSTVAVVPDPTPAPQPSQAVEPTTEPPNPGRRWPQRQVPSGPPSQAAGDGGSYGPPLDYPDQSLQRDLFGGDSLGTPPAEERAWDPRPRQDDEANRKSPGWFSRNILGDRR